ncbi:MAG: spermidine synthase [Gemmatimonadota bacterium]
MTPADLEILAYEDTELGVLCLRRRELLSAPGEIVTEITLDGEFLMSSRHTASEEALARIALDMHPDSELGVFVGGLGLGYTAHAALASSRVVSVEVVEFLPQVIDWLESDLVPLSEPLKRDRRFRAVRGDAYARLAGPPSERFDLILIDVDHSPDERLGEADDAFYTEEGLWRARRHLAPGGVLGVWSYAESSPFSRALETVFGDVRVEPVSYYNDLVDEAHTDWLFFATNRTGKGRESQWASMI